MTVRALLAAASAKKKVILPGPQNLIAGDLETRGFFGEVTSAELATQAELASLVGLTAGTIQTGSPVWLKFARNGKILYIPKTPLRRGITIAQYDARNLIIGADITVKDLPFKCRFMTGGNANPATASGGEWDDLMYPICTARPGGQPTWANYSSSELLASGSVAGSATFCQELRSGQSYHIYRGYASLQTFSQAGPTSDMNNYGWRPVLEYTGSL